MRYFVHKLDFECALFGFVRWKINIVIATVHCAHSMLSVSRLLIW